IPGAAVEPMETTAIPGPDKVSCQIHLHPHGLLTPDTLLQAGLRIPQVAAVAATHILQITRMRILPAPEILHGVEIIVRKEED
ncbi:hypothetical protein, partial [Vibrio cholerae]|uniref:hypothetical protein n=1 Tax=Vibrio cholerae TaxID=666 RepID=UPI001F3C6A7A